MEPLYRIGYSVRHGSDYDPCEVSILSHVVSLLQKADENKRFTSIDKAKEFVDKRVSQLLSDDIIQRFYNIKRDVHKYNFDKVPCYYVMLRRINNDTEVLISIVPDKLDII
jgi:hypothetical protein